MAKSVFMMTKAGINITNILAEHTALTERDNCRTEQFFPDRGRNTALISANLFSIFSHVGNVMSDVGVETDIFYPVSIVVVLLSSQVLSEQSVHSPVLIPFVRRNMREKS